jgi:hypothetical protein
MEPYKNLLNGLQILKKLNLVSYVKYCVSWINLAANSICPANIKSVKRFMWYMEIVDPTLTKPGVWLYLCAEIM